MIQNKNTTKETMIHVLDLYVSKWKIIALCLLIALGIAYLKIRYSTFEYEANATIKLKEDENSKRLTELSNIQNYGMFSNDFTNVIDEIEIIKSRSIITQVVKDLKLNVQYYVLGKVKGQEVYQNPPLNISFFSSDSMLAIADYSLFIKILSDTQFEISKADKKKLLTFDSNESTVYDFGKRISLKTGDFLITPNVGAYGSEPNSYVEIKIMPVAAVTEYYLGNIKIETTQKSNVIKLSLQESIKEKARLVLDKVIEKYNDDVVNDKEDIIKVTSDFITNRLDLVSSELEQVDFTAESLQKNNRLTALASQSNIYLQSERQTEDKIVTTSNQLQLIDYMSDHLAANNKNSDLLPADIGIADNSVSQITKSHNDLVLQRNRLLKNSSERNPTVVNLNNQISALKDNLNQSLDNIKSANKITLNSLNIEDSRIRGQIYSAPGKERQFRDIKRQQDIKESLYLYLLQKREETAISLGMSTTNAKIIDQAYTLEDPVSPKQQMIYLSAFLLGLIVPISIIYGRDLIDTKIYTKADVFKYIDAPYIGDIPKSNLKTRLINKIDYSPKAEAFRILRTNINFMLQDVDHKCKTIFLTSTTSQEGKSHTSINLAASFSFSEKRVLLLETDIRVPRVNDYLDIKNNKGLTEYISDRTLDISDVIVNIKDNPFFDVIPSGSIPPNPAELLMNDRVKTLFQTLKEQYDYIIVDTAAVGLVTDTLLISEFADMVIYIVSVNNVDRRQLHIGQTMYEKNRLPRMTVLLNGTVPKKGYGYGYGSGKAKPKRFWKS